MSSSSWRTWMAVRRLYASVVRKRERQLEHLVHQLTEYFREVLPSVSKALPGNRRHLLLR